MALSNCCDKNRYRIAQVVHVTAKGRLEDIQWRPTNRPASLRAFTAPRSLSLAATTSSITFSRSISSFVGTLLRLAFVCIAASLYCVLLSRTDLTHSALYLTARSIHPRSSRLVPVRVLLSRESVHDTAQISQPQHRHPHPGDYGINLA